MNEIQDIQNEQNTNPSYRVEYIDGFPGVGKRVDTETLMVDNYRLDKLITIKNEVTPMSQTKNDSKRETLFVNY